MKKFSFPLSRVIDWRDAQARVEEAKLQALYGELRAIDLQESSLKRDREEAERAVQARGGTGRELVALADFRRFTVAEHTRLESLRQDCSRRIASQIQVVAAKRRDVKLLERLKQKKLIVWNQEAAREIEHQAEDAYMAKWNAASNVRRIARPD